MDHFHGNVQFRILLTYLFVYNIILKMFHLFLLIIQVQCMINSTSCLQFWENTCYFTDIQRNFSQIAGIHFIFPHLFLRLHLKTMIYSISAILILTNYCFCPHETYLKYSDHSKTLVSCLIL